MYKVLPWGQKYFCSQFGNIFPLPARPDSIGHIINYLLAMMWAIVAMFYTKILNIMKELSFDELAVVEGGDSYSYWSCNMGMTVVGVFWGAMAGIATGGVGAAVVGVAWGGLTAYVCKNA